MYDRILLPTDMSTGVDRAIDHAVDAAQRYEATLHVLYVVDAEAYSSYPGDEYVHEFEGLETALEQSGRDAVAAIAETATAAGVETETVIRHGVPHEEILDYAEEAGVGGDRDRVETPARGVPPAPRQRRRAGHTRRRAPGHGREDAGIGLSSTRASPARLPWQGRGHRPASRAGFAAVGRISPYLFDQR